MGFAVSADAYDRFMGRFSTLLAVRFAEWAGVEPGMDVLDVGSGPGALSAALLDRVGSGSVSAIDPMPAFVAAVQQRLPAVRATVAPAESLPFDDDVFDAALANLVVAFMSDARVGLGEMRRVTRPGGAVAVSVWQHSDGISPLTPFWQGAHRVDPDAVDEALMLGAREGQLTGLLEECGLTDVRAGALSVEVRFDSFEDWWQPFLYGVGPAGAYLTAQTADRQEQVRAACEEVLGPTPFTVAGQAWCAAGTV